MSTIEMNEDKMICIVDGNAEKSVVTMTPSVITIEASKIILVGDKEKSLVELMNESSTDVTIGTCSKINLHGTVGEELC